MTPRAFTFLSFRVPAAPCLLAAVLAGCVATGAPAQDTDGDAAGGRIVDGPSNIRSFRPEGAAGIVDAGAINLSAVFEALGEDAALWYQHVLTLSNPFFEGRSPGRGGDLAAEYVSFYFRKYGLDPAFPVEEEMQGGAVGMTSSFKQEFDFRNPSPISGVNEAELTLGNRTWVLGEDFAVLGNSASGAVTAPLTFVGYSIDEGPDGYTSFGEDDDLTGRIALMLRYEPLDDEGLSQWSEERFSPQSGIVRKMRSIGKRNPAAILLVNPPGVVHGKTGLETLRSSGRFGRSRDVPVLQITPEVADMLLAKADPRGRDLETWRKLADAGEIGAVDLKQSARVTVIAELDVQDRLETRNVAGVLPGRGDLADKWIVIGGHYDHVGFGYTGTRANNVGKLHPGADDNASGTAGVLILARRFARSYAEAGDDANLRSILFMGFSAEESGLQGSRYYVEHPTVEASDISIMINMDMIGRLRDGQLSVGGTGTAEEFDDVLTPLFLESGLTINESRGGRGPSDHSSFYGAGVPVLFMFTGLHPRYHTPADYGYTVNPTGAIEVIDLVEEIAMNISRHPEQMTYVAAAGGGGGRNRTGSRVRLGVMPAYGTELDFGVQVEEVFPGTSAFKGGMKAGDVMLQWNSEEITDGSALMGFLRSASPGDMIRVKVLRGGEELELDLTLEARPEE